MTYHTVVQGRDFEIFGWAGRYLFVLALVLVVAGVVVLIRSWWQTNPTSTAMAAWTQPTY